MQRQTTNRNRSDVTTIHPWCYPTELIPADLVFTVLDQWEQERKTSACPVVLQTEGVIDYDQCNCGKCAKYDPAKHGTFRLQGDSK